MPNFHKQSSKTSIYSFLYSKQFIVIFVTLLSPIGTQVHIASTKNSSYFVRLFHIDLLPNLTVGSKVTSGGMHPQASQRNYPPQPTPFIKPGGCTTDQDCYQYCQSHIDQCLGFQQSNQTQPTQPVFVNPQPQSSSQSNPQTQQQVQPSNNQPPQNPPSNTADQQKMCSQTPGCTWTGSMCNCSSGH